jgi:hypothetical protein
MTRRTNAWVGARLFGVARAKSSAMQAREPRVVERHFRRERWDGADAVTPGARAFGMTTRTEVALARRANAVLSNPIAVVNQVTRRECVLGA